MGSAEDFKETAATRLRSRNKEEIPMAKSKKSQKSKPSVKVRDLSPRKNAHGGSKINVEYKPKKADGSLDAGLHFKYDIKGNKEG